MLRIQRPGHSTIGEDRDRVLPDIFPHFMVTKLSSLILFLHSTACTPEPSTPLTLDRKDADVTNRSWHTGACGLVL